MILPLLLALSVGPIEAIRSEECVSCHNIGRITHPVAVEYRPGRGLKPAPRELLVNGRIECTTCHVSHDLETAERYRLRVPWEQQAELCTSCHDLN